MASAIRVSIVKLLLCEVLVAATPTHRHYDSHVLDSVEVLPRGNLASHHTADEEDAALLEVDQAENSSNSMVRSETYGAPKDHPNLPAWKQVTKDWIYSAVSHSSVFTPVVPVLMAWASRMTNSVRPPLPMSLALVGSATWSYLSCAWDDKEQDEFSKKVVGGSFIGIVLAFGLVCLTASIMCCGCCMDSILTKTVPVGLAVAFFSLMAMSAPYASAIVACGSFDDNMCSSCVKNGFPPCTKADRTALQEACKAVAWYVGYFLAFGWLSGILAWVSFGMAWCMVCGCCNCKIGEEKIKREGKGPNGQKVVGQPVR